jgi:hypothetical protein
VFIELALLFNTEKNLEIKQGQYLEGSCVLHTRLTEGGLVKAFLSFNHPNVYFKSDSNTGGFHSKYGQRPESRLLNLFHYSSTQVLKCHFHSTTFYGVNGCIQSLIPARFESGRYKDATEAEASSFSRGLSLVVSLQNSDTKR